MKILILLFMAGSLGLSECSDVFYFPKKGYSPKEVLEVFFNITDNDLNKKCDKVDTNEKTRWYKIGKACSDLQEAVLSPQKKGTNKYQPQINLIKIALPCATKKRVNKSLNFYKHPPKKSSQDVPTMAYTAEEVLQVFFNITDDDLDKKCDKVDSDKKARWKEIKKTISDLEREYKAKKHEDPHKKKKNLKDKKKNKVPLKVIKTALPCADDARVNKSLSFYNLPENQ